MKFSSIFIAVTAVGGHFLNASASKLRGPFEDQVAAVALGGHKKQQCRDDCMKEYCPADGSCKETCKGCCEGSTFSYDDSDFPDDNNQRGERCFLEDDNCSGDLFCKVGDYSCTEEDNPSGRCQPVAGDDAPCPLSIAPVCGCDGETYTNRCLAYAAGVNIAKNEECELPGNGGEKCYLNDDDICTDGLFCRVGNYACAEESNPQGRCAPEPLMCTYELAEVCGCDGKTYSNPCSAYAAGVNIEKNEPCRQESNWGRKCSFDDQDFCGNGLFCKIQDYYCKYEPNPAGLCRNEPLDTACPFSYEPVCGCDCVTYSNRCQAYAAGVNIYSNSICPSECQYPSEIEENSLN